ncbi:hypothetical protein PSHT_00343 [Puccinia striiformis]|uniref:Uncharacterized protein n=1 Tax=Puccinia striiformis TaxID=27350 RepID=A0A2S4WND2_9BASI|nr:hypothetical protein PSHT_00343 [Puccinia striiformis]
MSVKRLPTTSGARPATCSATRQLHANINNQSVSSDEEALICDSLARFGPSDTLRPDGANFRTWYRELAGVALTYLVDVDFFNRDPLEWPARSILIGLVD